MPVVAIHTNVHVAPPLKAQLLERVLDVFSTEAKTHRTHVHVHIADGQFLAFGGDHVTPAAYVIVRSASQQIPSEARQSIIKQLIPAMTASIAELKDDRVTTLFEELPVERIAVGTDVMLL